MGTNWLHQRFAFSTSNVLSGSVRVIPGSHRAQAEFVETPDAHNMLVRGQTIKNVDASKAVHMNLEAGEFSIHHESIVHSSEPNNSDDRRIGNPGMREQHGLQLRRSHRRDPSCGLQLQRQLAAPPQVEAQGQGKGSQHEQAADGQRQDQRQPSLGAVHR